MKSRIPRLVAVIAGGALLLAACSGGGGGPDDGPPGAPDTLSGIVRAPSSNGAGVGGTIISLCQAGTDCSVVRETEIPDSNTGQEALFRFTGLNATTWNLRGYKELQLIAPPGPPPPDAWYEGFLEGARTGEVENILQLELDASAPTNGTAVVTGIMRLPGSLSTASTVGSGDVQAVAAAETGDFGFVSTQEFDLSAAAAHLTGGEIIVSFRPGVISTQSVLTAAGHTLLRVAGEPGAERQLYETGASSVEEVLAIAAELAARPDVEFAMPNWRLEAFDTPNDPEYRYQWHYEAFNMPAAWDIRKGGVNVAVLDTGSIAHPDLQFLPGYDFISDAAEAGDGGGRDSDPRDLGDDFHGAHVAGTIGARTNNGTGVAGVSWATSAQVVPVRVLGVDGGGAFFDILDGMSWAIGDRVAGVPDNANPVRILNLSLGAELGVSCSAAMGGNTSFFDDLRSRNIITVVAAGNDNRNTSGTFPANCPGVITVGATGATNSRAPYSNYGNEVDIMAPGGDLATLIERSGTRMAAGIISTVGGEGYGMMQGTSMAAPHISGLVSLMLARNPGLTIEQVRSALRSSAVPGSCDTGGCGAGLVDAAAALAAVSGGTPVPPPPPPAPPPPVSTGGNIYVVFENTDGSGGQIVDFENNAMDFEFVIYNLEPGTYDVYAWIDLDGDVDPDANEPYGEYGRVTLVRNSVTNGVNFTLEADVP